MTKRKTSRKPKLSERAKMAKFIRTNNANPANEEICDDLAFWRDECEVRTLAQLQAWIEPPCY